MTLGFLDACDIVLSVVTYDSTTIHNTIAVAEVFNSIGYPPEKVHYLVNRADSTGGIGKDELARSLGRRPEFEVVSDGRLVVQANNEGMPFVVSQPGCGREPRCAPCGRRPCRVTQSAAPGETLKPCPIHAP